MFRKFLTIFGLTLVLGLPILHPADGVRILCRYKTGPQPQVKQCYVVRVPLHK